MKRILTIVMCAVMLVSVMAVFAGCEEDTTPTQGSTTTTTTTQSTTTTKNDETTTTTTGQTTTEPSTTTTTTKPTTTTTTKPTTTTTKKPTTTTTTTKSTTTTTTVQAEVNERDAFIGSWKTELDMTDIINEAYENSDLAGYVVIEDFSFDLIFTFKTDGTYSIRADRTAAEAMYEDVRKDYEKGIRAYFTDALAEYNIDMTVDEYLASEGVTMQELVEYEFSDETLDYLIDAAKTDGRYEVEDGICYMNYDLEEEIDKTDKEQYDPYTISGDTLTLYANAEDEIDMVLTRV